MKVLIVLSLLFIVCESKWNLGDDYCNKWAGKLTRGIFRLF